MAQRTEGGVDWRGDVVVIGAGIVGLATAREILRRRPGTKLVVLEKEAKIGQHQTGHNSGVIHAGIYYKPGTLKARLCVAGGAELIRYCDEKQIQYRLCGKLIVATDEAELPRLAELERRATANGCQGIRMVEADEIREIEPHCRGIRALWSPMTGIVDYGVVAYNYGCDIQSSGGEICVNHEVTSISTSDGESIVHTDRGDFGATQVIACAGIQSDRVAKMTGAPAAPLIAPFRGDYYVLRPERQNLIRTNIYPVPDPQFPFLGVHFTRMIDGSVECGPNAVLAFGREAYRFFSLDPRDLLETVSYRGFLRMAARHWRTGLGEMWRSLSKAAFVRALRRLVPAIRAEHLEPAPAGIRAQAVAPDGGLVDDFLVREADRVVNVCNAPSPAATASLQIGSAIVDRLAPRFG
jgi:L-2-hydroxyglutarate oxidase LhgO